MKIRSGCEGGGKGPLIQKDKSATLATNNDQYLFVPVVLDDQGGQQITVRDDGISPTLRVEMHGHPPCIVSAGFKGSQDAESGGNGDGKTASTITGDHESGITDYTTVVCMAHGQANAEVVENCAPCLNCNHEKPIVFDKEVYNSGINATGGHYISEGGPAPTLRGGGHPPGVCIRYIVRRLITTECARLQGFPDRWGDIEPLDVSDEAEVTLWREIYKTYCEINGIKVSASILYKPDRLKAWHDKLLTDSTEYKMWGNGIALPNALYVMQGIEEVMNRA